MNHKKDEDEMLFIGHSILVFFLIIVNYTERDFFFFVKSPHVYPEQPQTKESTQYLHK